MIVYLFSFGILTISVLLIVYGLTHASKFRYLIIAVGIFGIVVDFAYTLFFYLLFSAFSRWGP